MSNRINIVLQDEAYNTYTTNVDPTWTMSKIFETAADILSIPKENILLANAATLYHYRESYNKTIRSMGFVPGIRLTILKEATRG